MVSAVAGARRGGDLCARKRLFRQRTAVLGRALPRAGTGGLRGAGRIPLPGGRGGQGPVSGAGVPDAGGGAGVRALPRRFSPAARPAGGGAALRICALRAAECPCDRRKPRPVFARGRGLSARRAALTARQGRSTAEPDGAEYLRAALRPGSDGGADGAARADMRGLVFGGIPQPACAPRTGRAADRGDGYLRDVHGGAACAAGGGQTAAAGGDESGGRIHGGDGAGRDGAGRRAGAAA